MESYKPGHISALASVTFSDVAAYFFKEEWDLLQEWQKGLYRDVMREIHGALITMGYTILNPGILLKIHEQEEPRSQERSESTERNTHPKTSPPHRNPDILLRIKSENPCSRGDPVEEGRNRLPTPRAGALEGSLDLSGPKQERKPSFNQQQEPGENEDTGHPIENVDILVMIKEEEESYIRDLCDTLGKEDPEPPIQEGESICWKNGEWNPDDRPNQSNCQAMLPGEADENIFHYSGSWAMGQRLHGTKQIVQNSSNHRLDASVEHLNGFGQQPGPVAVQGGRIYPCTECERCFTAKAYLKKHQRTHTGERPYKCGSCEKTFSQKSNLNVHLRTHTGEKPYTCPLCQKGFLDNSGLIQHRRIHTGEKPYKCAACEKCFCQKEHLKVHLRTHTGEKPYSCIDCKKRFSQRSYLEKHRRTHMTKRTS